MKRRRLKTIEDVRRALADVYNRMDSDLMDPAKGSKLAYVGQILSRMIEGGDFEKRLEELERRIGS